MKQFKKVIASGFFRSFILLGFFLCLSTVAFAQKQSTESALLSIEERLAAVEESQAKIIENQTEILEKLKQVKIWIRRM